MSRLFAVMRTRGARWSPAEPLEGQDDWRGHADFMNALVAEGFVLLGGPLDGKDAALLIIQAADEAEVRARLAADPWTVAGLLAIESVHPWTLRLGERVFERSMRAAPKADKSQHRGQRKAHESQHRGRSKANKSQRKRRCWLL
jgi:uncharacterized protein YciI